LKAEEFCARGFALNANITLRDYLAGQALAVISTIDFADMKMPFDAMANAAYALADSMLAAREKQSPAVVKLENPRPAGLPPRGAE